MGIPRCGTVGWSNKRCFTREQCGPPDHLAELGATVSAAPTLGRINFYADVEFRGVALQAHCRVRRWHWQAGLESDPHFYTGGGTWQPSDVVGDRKALLLPADLSQDQ